MKKILFTIILFAIILSCNMPASASGEDEIVATWRGGKITLKEFEDFALRNSFNSDPAEAAESHMDKKREALDIMINSKMIWNIYDSLKLDTVKAIKDAYERRLYRTAYNYTLFTDSVQNKIVTEKRINEFCDLLKNKYNISHILFENEEKARSIYKDLKTNSNEFSKYAKEYSNDASNKDNGGNLGWNIITNFVPEFSNTVLKLEIGQITEPFKTKFGWHIAKLNDILPNGELGSLEKEKKNIRYAILSKHKDDFDRINNDWENYLLDRYNVFVDSQKVTDFVNYFRTLAAKDINTACDASYYNTGIILSHFDGDTVSVKTALDNISRSVNAAVQMKKEIPEVKTDDVHGLIFYTHIFKIRPLITDDLGYTKRKDVLDKVHEGMVIDLREYLIYSYNGSKDQEKEWFEPYRRSYNLKVNHAILEKSFYNPSDTRK